MAWSNITSATQLTTISDTIQWFDEVIQVDPDEVGEVHVEFDPPATPTDDLSVHVRRALEASSENWDDFDLFGFVIENSVDPAKRSFTLPPGYKYRVGVQSTGTTDDHTSADMEYRIGSPD